MQLKYISKIVLFCFMLNSCTKELSSDGALEPISIIAPTTNPVQSLINQSIGLSAKLTTDQNIDSVILTYQFDSLNVGYAQSLASPLYVAKFSTQNNVQSMSYTFDKKTTSNLVSKIYINFNLVAGTRNYNKQLAVSIIK